MLKTQEKKHMSIVPVEEDSFMSDLLALMKTDEFKRFQGRHMSNSVESKTSLMYFELYRAIESIYRDMMDEDMPDEIAQAILQSIMRRRDYRKSLIGTVMNYLESSEAERDLKEKVKELLLGSEQLLSLTDEEKEYALRR